MLSGMLRKEINAVFQTKTFSERIRSKFHHSQLNKKKASFALHFLKRTLQRFASKTLQIDSKAVEKFQHLRFRATCVLESEY